MATLDFEKFKYFYVTKDNKGLTLFLFITLVFFLSKCKTCPKQMQCMLCFKHNILILFSKLWDVTMRELIVKEIERYVNIVHNFYFGTINCI